MKKKLGVHSMTNRKYLTPDALLASLSDRLKMKEKSGKLDIQRMRRQIAFDRLVVCLSSKETSLWVLKGGYAMELRLASFRGNTYKGSSDTIIGATLC